MTIEHEKFDVWMKPVRVNYYSLDWRKAEAFLKEFVSRIPSRISALERNVRSTEGFEGWKADGSEESVLALGSWVLKVGRLQPVHPDDVRLEVYNPDLHPSTVECMLELAKQDVNAELTE